MKRFFVLCYIIVVSIGASRATHPSDHDHSTTPNMGTPYCAGEGKSTVCNKDRENYKDQAFLLFNDWSSYREDTSIRTSIEENILTHETKIDAFLKGIYGEKADFHLCIELPNDTSCKVLLQKPEIMKKIMRFYLFRQYFQTYQQAYTKTARATYITDSKLHISSSMANMFREEAVNIEEKRFEECGELREFSAKPWYPLLVNNLYSRSTYIALDKRIYTKKETDALLSSYNQAYISGNYGSGANANKQSITQGQSCVADDGSLAVLFVDGVPTTYDIENNLLYIPPEYEVYQGVQPAFGRRVENYILFKENYKGDKNKVIIEGRYDFMSNSVYIRALCKGPKDVDCSAQQVTDTWYRY